jgi:hypothetical protein
MSNNTQLKDVSASNKKIIFKALKVLKIKEVSIEYNGYGDSGQINDVLFYKTSDKPVNIDKLSNGLRLIGLKRSTGWSPHSTQDYEDAPPDYTLNQAINDLCYELLEEKHPGWEINSGSDGTFTFTVSDEKIKWEHSDIVEERYLYEYEV